MLTHLSLQNFRSYTKSAYAFPTQTTVILGPNTAGKTNFLEAVYLLATGKSFRAEKETQMIRFGQDVARVKGTIVSEAEGTTDLEVVIAEGEMAPDTSRSYTKRYLVNSVPRRRVDFAGKLPALLFLPSDLDIIIGSPSLRRSFLDDVLELTDREYRIAMTSYTRALRQRNALLEVARETGLRNIEQFQYWDELLIHNGSVITDKRQAVIDYMNTHVHDVLPIRLHYDKSVISEARLLQYKDAEMGAGVTLVGPHRDDLEIFLGDKDKELRAKSYGSRGQQRLVVLQLKMLQLQYIEDHTGQRPLLLLDDIFSELDSGHIELVLSLIGKQQTILTTTHKEFLGAHQLSDMGVIELSQPR